MFNFLNKISPLVDEINTRKDEYSQLSDEELTGKTAEFKRRLKDGEALDDILPEAFAAVREAAKRALGLFHFDVQLMAGVAFHRGMVAEQKTGEGKTLSATTALYLNALTGRGVHLVTVNDYLARRDAGWMGPVYRALGMSVGIIFAGAGDQPAALFDPEYTDKSATDDRLAHLKPTDRKTAYNADITYGTNNEFGFDYLRDNMAYSLEQLSQREHHFAIVDEVDSILIDEARTPLIISAPDTEPTDKYYRFSRIIDELNSDIDYTIDEKLRVAQLTDHGLKKIEKKLGIDNLYEKDFDSIHHIEQALRARSLYRRDKDYVVKDDQVIIVDEHTGRLMFGRRYSDGLHQAIEAKESVKIQQESKTLATISLQNYFRMYEKLAGMTGTAVTEAEEFKKIYNLEVLVVPTHVPAVRLDRPDQIYKTQRAKYTAIVNLISDLYHKGQPVLVGTRSIEINEILSDFLKHKKVPHQVLNAKNHEREAQILANAGREKAVTVATNMAGRGVDIVLGGDPAGTAKAEWNKNHKKVVELGGLFVIGSERHESRRIDNQLRGRSGRQGDPGESRFFVSLEDEIMRIFGGDRIAGLMTTLRMPENEAIEHGLVSRAIEQAQAKVENWFFDQRKRVVEYDDVVNKQREIIYRRRQAILDDSDSEQLHQKTLEKIDAEIRASVIERATAGYTDIEINQIVKEFVSIIPFDDASFQRLEKKIKDLDGVEQITDHLLEIANNVYRQRQDQLGTKVIKQIEQAVTLRTMDELWMEHLDALDDLREGIGLRGYAQQEPLVEYKKEAFNMFESLLAKVDSEIVHRIYRVQPMGLNEPAPAVRSPLPSRRDVGTRRGVATAGFGRTSDFSNEKSGPSEKDKDSLLGKVRLPFGKDTKKELAFSSAFRQMATNRPAGAPIVNKRNIGRNDPCWCGSEKKYKRCHYPN